MFLVINNMAAAKTKRKTSIECAVLQSESGYRYTVWVNRKSEKKLELMKYDPRIRARALFKQRKAPSPKKN
jgi:ribosomal protein L33